MLDAAVTLASALVGFLLFGLLTGRWSRQARERRATAAAAARVPLPMRVPVPWLFVLTFVAGVVLELLVPVRLNAEAARIYFWAGAAVLGMGVLLSASGLVLFRRAETTTVPFEQPATLVQSGPYRFSRNPMYVGLTLVYLGVAGLYTQIWPLVLLPFFLGYVNGVVIPVEERSLRATFGPAYDNYCDRVRRWV
jgi:protein-S-isoprenylcysteine O-methyltransferase Ste14